jgi:hypothetical protein
MICTGWLPRSFIVDAGWFTKEVARYGKCHRTGIKLVLSLVRLPRPSVVLRQRSIIALCLGAARHVRYVDDRLREAHRSVRWVDREEQKQAVGRSRGGRNTKIHGLADV